MARRSSAAKFAVPADLEPMYATLGHEVPAEAGWAFEPKYDGVRVLAYASPDGARLMTRNGRDKAGQFPEVVEALRELSSDVGRPLVLDGEVVAIRAGKPARFQALQDRVHLKDEAEIGAGAERAPAALLAFDLLTDGGDSLLDEPWTDRRARLDALFGGRESPRVRPSEVLRVGGEAGLKRARERGWEGVIAKRADAVYRPGKRSDAWLKLKVEFRQEFVVGGWTDPQRSRKHLGSLLVGYYEDDELVFAGGVGTGFNRQSLKEMRDLLDALSTGEPPFREAPRTRTPAHWVCPEMVVEIKFVEWTADGRLRTPVFLGVRDDKPARQVTRESTSVQRGGPK